MFERILIANRGEIALRVIRACKELGIGTVAIYSEADRGSQYLELADEAHCIGTAKSVDSYCESIALSPPPKSEMPTLFIPVFGFLAENAHFNEVCRSCRSNSSAHPPNPWKNSATKPRLAPMAIAAGVPVVPGSDGLIDSEQAAIEAARKIGYPVLIKATAGGEAKECESPMTKRRCRLR